MRYNQTSKRTQDLLEWDKQHIVHPMYEVRQNIGVVLESGKGIMVRDTEGKEYMDLCSQLVNVNLGHGRQDLIDVAVAQMNKLCYAQLFRGFTNLPAIELGQKLAQVLPKGLDHFLWVSGGSEAVDSAFRIALSYWRAKGKSRYKIISLYNSYHGTVRGVANATMVRQGSVNELPPVAGHLHIPNYFCYRCALNKKYPDCGIDCAKFLKYTIENEGPDSVAAFIAESEQGPGGFISPPPEYWPMVREICSKYDVLLIADEVMAGFGRTGKMFAIEHWDVIPDMITMSKAIVSGYLPFGAVAFSDKIFDALGYLPVGVTQAGNPICCALASKCLDVYREERIPEYVANIGQYAKARIEKEFLTLPHVGGLSGLGLMLGLEIVVDKETKKPTGPEVRKLLIERGLEKGVILRVQENRICFSPPLVATQEEIDRALDIIYSLLADLKI